MKPGPFRPGPVICGLLRLAPLGYARVEPLREERVSRALHDALCTGRWLAEDVLELRLGDVPAAVGASGSPSSR